MEINKSNVTLEMIETKTKTAEISVEEILDIVYEKLERVCSNYTIYEDKPSLDYNGGDENVEVYICGVDETYDSSDIITNVKQMVDEGLKAYIKKMSERKEPAKVLKPKEEGENGVL